MSKEVVKKEASQPVVFNQDLGMGASEAISMSDIQLDRIIFMQSGSKLVKKDEARQGAIFLAKAKKEVGYKKEKELEVILIKSTKYWIEQDADSKEFLGRKPANSPEDYPWEETINGRTIKRTYTHSFFVLLPSEIAEGVELPYELAFRSTSLECAKSINTKLFNMNRKGIPSYAKVFGITTEVKEKGEHSWFVPLDRLVRDVNALEAKSCESWLTLLKTAKVELAEEESNESETSQGSY